MMKIKIFIVALIVLCNQSYATQLIQGNVSPITKETGCPTPAVLTFDVGVQSIAGDIANGIVYVGLKDGGGSYAVSSFQRTLDSGQVPKFKPRAVVTQENGGVQGGSITFLAMATSPGETCSRVAGVDETGHPNRVFILDITNKVHFSESGIPGDSDNFLRLYNPTLNQNGDNANFIAGLAANRCFIFAGVGENSFPSTNTDSGMTSGIAVVAIDQCTLDLHQTAAVPGDMGIKAQQLDNQSSFIRIGGNADPLRHPIILDDAVQLLWDDQLERLYMGVSVQSCTSDLAPCTAPQQADDGMRSIVLGKVGCCPQNGTLTLIDFAPQAAFTNATNNIVGVRLMAEGDELLLGARRLGMMHCSTGPSYLIVYGGNDDLVNSSGTTTGNRIFALPLVDKCNADDPDQGKLADKDSFDVTTHTYRQPALTHDELTESTELFAQVGNGPLPIEPTQVISYMQVIGDAVYVSLKIPQDDTNETGVLYSQALFNEKGEIKSWTPWTKRVWPICGFPNSPSNGQVSFFNVDAVTGKVLAVDGTPQQTVRITEWTDGSACDPCSQCSLATVINRSLCQGSYSVLDLDQSTRGIGADIPYRYALFGGTCKVDFALISQSRSPEAPFNINPTTSIPYPQRVTVDFCCPDFFLETELPGCVNVLEYSRRTTDEGDTNYFFAGTDDGLFVFAKPDGSGFNVNEFGLLSQKPLCNGVWHKVANKDFAKSITDVKTSGNTLYVMTFETTSEKPFHSEILRVNFQTTINAMFDPSNVKTIASSGEAGTALSQTLLFTEMEVMQTSDDGTQEQLVVTTNNGIFQSKKTDGVQDATSSEDAEWTLLLNNTLFYGIGAVDNAAILSTVWPFSAQDACGLRTFERSSIHQLNSQTDPTPTFNFVPDFFNHLITCGSCACETPCDKETQCCPETTPTPCDLATTTCATSCEPECCVTPCLVNNPCSDLKLFEKINYFWSDGGRRFFIITPTNSKLACLPCCGKVSCNCCPQQNLRFLEVTPFNTCAWNVSDPCKTVLRDCVLRTQSAFYWVRPIGMTGIILAGTQNGVVALE